MSYGQWWKKVVKYFTQVKVSIWQYRNTLLQVKVWNTKYESIIIKLSFQMGEVRRLLYPHNRFATSQLGSLVSEGVSH